MTGKKEPKKKRVILEYATSHGVRYADMDRLYESPYIEALASAEPSPPMVQNLLISTADASEGLAINFEPSLDEVFEAKHVTANIFGFEAGETIGCWPLEYKIYPPESGPIQSPGDFRIVYVNPEAIEIKGVYVFYREDYRMAREEIAAIVNRVLPLCGGHHDIVVSFHRISDEEIFTLELDHPDSAERVTQVLAVSEPEHRVFVLPDFDLGRREKHHEDSRSRTYRVLQGISSLERMEFPTFKEFQQQVAEGNTAIIVVDAVQPNAVRKFYDRIVADPIASKVLASVLAYVIVQRVFNSIWDKISDKKRRRAEVSRKDN